MRKFEKVSLIRLILAGKKSTYIVGVANDSDAPGGGGGARGEEFNVIAITANAVAANAAADDAVDLQFVSALGDEEALVALAETLRIDRNSRDVAPVWRCPWFTLGVNWRR